MYQAAKELIDDERLYSRMSEASNPYGDGFASERIVNHIKYYFDLITEKPSDFEENRLFVQLCLNCV